MIRLLSLSPLASVHHKKEEFRLLDPSPFWEKPSYGQELFHEI